MEYAKGSDVAIHECFLPPTLLIERQGFAPLEALVVGTQGHTSPEQFGKVMFEVEPLPEVVGPIYDEVNEKYGTDHEPAFK